MTGIENTQLTISSSYYAKRFVQAAGSFFQTSAYGALVGLTLGLNQKMMKLALEAFKNFVYHTDCLFRDPRPLSDRVVSNDEQKIKQLNAEEKTLEKLFENTEKKMTWARFCNYIDVH